MTYVLCIVVIPHGKQLVKSPLDTLNAFLLATDGILGGKGGWRDIGPVGLEVEVEETRAREEQEHVGGTGRYLCWFVDGCR